MSRKIFINLPVTDLPRSIAFYAALGCVNEPKFSDDTAACMIMSETIHVMLLSHAKWATFTTRPIPPRGSSEVSLAFTCENRDEVDQLVTAAGAAGGTADINPPEDHGFMYQRSLADPDDHVWEPFWMDQEMAAAGADA